MIIDLILACQALQLANTPVWKVSNGPNLVDTTRSRNFLTESSDRKTTCMQPPGREPSSNITMAVEVTIASPRESPLDTL